MNHHIANYLAISMTSSIPSEMTSARVLYFQHVAYLHTFFHVSNLSTDNVLLEKSLSLSSCSKDVALNKGNLLYVNVYCCPSLKFPCQVDASLEKRGNWLHFPCQVDSPWAKKKKVLPY